MSLAPALPSIALAVHGRFHAFDLANGLTRRNARPHLFTNYPARAVRRFGFPSGPVTTFVSHGVLQRAALHAPGYSALEPTLHRLFGRWAARAIDPTQFDILHLWSSVAEEALERARALPGRRAILTLKRGSAHIAIQNEILLAEEQRAQCPLDRPSAWMIGREQREYALADRICCLSRFAYDSFRAQGIPADRLAITPLGVNVSHFRPRPEILADRAKRMLGSAPLRVLTVGSFSFRKGILDYRRIVTGAPADCEFRFVGDVPPEGRRMAREMNGRVDFHARVPQSELSPHFAWADVFLFPTLEDGFASVLNQAAAAGLPILATTNCSAPDFVVPGRTGWILPIRQPEAFLQRLAWCQQHRADLAEMAAQVAQAGTPGDWSAAAAALLSAVGPSPTAEPLLARHAAL
jgi:glycosyltransferase involved in cell wall biosynthesis